MKKGEKTPKKHLILSFSHNFQIKMESIHSFFLLFLPNVLLIVSHPPACATVSIICCLFPLVPNPQSQVQPTPSFGAPGRNALPSPSRSSGGEIPSPNTDKALTELNKKQLHPPPEAFHGACHWPDWRISLVLQGAQTTLGSRTKGGGVVTEM